jgi:hypothetical protein
VFLCPKRCCVADCNTCAVPNTLTLTDSNGSITITRVGTNNVWTYGRSLGTQTVIKTPPDPSPNDCNTTTGAVAYGWNLTCIGGVPTPRLGGTVWNGTCNFGITGKLFPAAPSNNSYGVAPSASGFYGVPGGCSVTATSFQCSPFFFQGTVGPWFGGAGGFPVPTGLPSGTVTITP